MRGFLTGMGMLLRASLDERNVANIAIVDGQEPSHFIDQYLGKTPWTFC